jgi:hypothetical protein
MVRNIGSLYPDKTLVLIHPSHQAHDRNQMLRKRLLDDLADWNIDAIIKETLPTAPVLGLFTRGAGGLVEVHSSSFSRLAHVLAARRFFRDSWGLA